jgi:hypothetical protein
MAAIAFDTLKFARRLKEVGVPEAQAEAQAELMAEAFVFNMDAVVTTDYLEQCLDARFASQDARIAKEFAAQDARIDQKFSIMERHLDERFTAQDERFVLQDERFAAQDRRFEDQDRRFEEQDRCFDDQDRRFTSIDQFIVDQKACNQRFEDHLLSHDQRFNSIDLTLIEIHGELKLLRWMLALIVITTVVPVLQGWFTRFVLAG